MDEGLQARLMTDKTVGLANQAYAEGRITARERDNQITTAKSLLAEFLVPVTED
jgi:hypothetical protein